VKGSTLNKDVNKMRTFLGWAGKKRYVADDLTVKRIKVAKKPVVALSCAQIRKLLITAAK